MARLYGRYETMEKGSERKKKTQAPKQRKTREVKIEPKVAIEPVVESAEPLISSFTDNAYEQDIGIDKPITELASRNR